MAAIGLKFAAVKADLATVVANGVPPSDPRVLSRANEATKLLFSQRTSKGEPLVPVGCMATYAVTATGQSVWLPKELENAVYWEVAGAVPTTPGNQGDIQEGWYDLVNNSTYVDPNMGHDNPVDDLGLFPDPVDPSILRRKYSYPGLQSGAVVNVTGVKRYLAMTGDDDNMLIQNVPALKLAILSLEHRERGAGSFQEAKAYLMEAVADLEGEVARFLSDPRRVMKRKAAYQADRKNALAGTLRQVRAKLALEIPGFLSRGRSEITYLIFQAVAALVENRNQLAITGRISVHDEVAEIPFNEGGPDDVLSWTDYAQIKWLVQSYLSEGPEPQQIQASEEYEKRAFEAQRLQLIEQTELARHTKYTEALDQYVQGTFGWTVARVALEIPEGLTMTTKELERLVSMAEMRIMERGKYKGTIKTMSATIYGGDVLFPRDVEAVIGTDICDQPVSIRSFYFQYQKNGPGHCFACENDFIDEGEVYFPQKGDRRRKFKYRGSCTSPVPLNAVCKIRWLQKTSCDEMVIKNFEAVRLYAQGILLEAPKKAADGSMKTDVNGATKYMQLSLEVLEKELNEYLAGIEHVPEYNVNQGYGFDCIGDQV